MQKLKMIKPLLWLKQRNALLLSFLNGATSDTSSHKKKMCLLISLSRFKSLNLNIITPFSFRQNLVMYSSTNSKTTLQLNSYWRSAGSYTSLCDILLQQAPPLMCPSKSNVLNTINNNQKVEKCGRRIKEGSNIPVSICTTVDHIQTKPVTFFQNEKRLSHKNWLG